MGGPHFLRRRYALTTLPDFRQLVQTRTRLLAPFTMARTGRRFTFQRRRLTLWAWLIAFPNCGPLPQTSHTRAMTDSPESNSEGTARYEGFRALIKPLFYRVLAELANCETVLPLMDADGRRWTQIGIQQAGLSKNQPIY